MITSIPKTSWENKTLVQYATQEPTSILEQKKSMESLEAKVIGGAIVAVPHIICSNTGSYMMSSTKDEMLEKSLPALRGLGQVVNYPGNVSYAALDYLELIRTLQFGLAGHELSLLLIKHYNGAPRNLVEYSIYFKRFSRLATNGVLDNDF